MSDEISDLCRAASAIDPVDRQTVSSELLEAARDEEMAPRLAAALVAVAHYLVGQVGDADVVDRVGDLDVHARQHFAWAQAAQRDVASESFKWFWNELAILAADGVDTELVLERAVDAGIAESLGVVTRWEAYPAAD